ncbi:phosphogluconate dehydratase [Amycolatopsis pithecellobii]|uniref:Phosphogluconate dehydratase n=1 Tax=Amycolatopsis pithecellobii TaxID=664692 RepID=A0A6N7Z1L6_9PSEU|nr:phosphogluconate dehydratase [Amycolatopsis pithecellobii]MTD53580.1 phosphogluconate dehydratase [Amycolatopsis pithecellobii]
MHPSVEEVTHRIIERSAATRRAYLERVAAAHTEGPVRAGMACSNLAHGFAACHGSDRLAIRGLRKPAVAIVSAYNDLLSAHQPLHEYPEWIKDAVRSAGGVAQFAGGVPAMCDGITQGRSGMELSLFSREVIAMATGIALSHEMFDGALLLGVCDKIVPGLLIGALAFGHLPAILVPAGPMASGLPNKEKARVRQLFAEGRTTREALLEAESASYHSAGTCTFYGTANSNQLVVEVMGLHLPGASFVPPGTPLRRALTEEAGRRMVALAHKEYTPLAEVVSERSVVNGVVALLATGGSTNHTMHLVAIAAAAGIELTWDDFADLSSAVPLLANVYPNGKADINHFHAAGGVPFLVGTLLDAGLLHENVRTVAGVGLHRYRAEPVLLDGELTWREAPRQSLDPAVLRPVSAPFAADGGLRMLRGNLGRAVIKVSAVAPEHRVVRAPARVFTSQQAFSEAFQAGELDRDVAVVIRNQGPRANGMPELHGLTPALGALMDRGHRVALITDGRMSGASGKVPSAIQLTPEAAASGPLSRVEDGDEIVLDAAAGQLDILVDARELASRPIRDSAPDEASWTGTGRELFTALRRAVGPADQGAGVFGPMTPDHFAFQRGYRRLQWTREEVCGDQRTRAAGLVPGDAGRGAG